MKKLVVLELNELCPPLMNRFMEGGELPNFTRLRDESIVRTTDAGASGESLNPWVQWTDVHTGLKYTDHGLCKLNEAHKFEGKFTWDLLAERFDVSSWVCGSMNAGYSPSFKGRFLPDPWTVDVEPFPPQEMDDYYQYVSQGVKGHSSGKATISSGAFVKSLLRLGVSASTVLKLARQIVSEKLRSKEDWERAMLLDWIQFDVFKHYYLEESPRFATFFSNSVAHYQHHYWKHFDPSAFSDSDFVPDQAKAGAILKAYKNTDDIVGAIIEMVGDDTGVLFATALSQQPFVAEERYYYHIHREQDFRAHFGVDDSIAYKAVMADQFNLEAASEEQAEQVEKNLLAYEMESNEYFHVGNNQLFLVTRNKNVVQAQCRVTKSADAQAHFFDTRTGERSKLYDHFYQMNDTKAGVHHPEGLYWFKAPGKSHEVVREPCPPSQVHHDIMEYFAA